MGAMPASRYVIGGIPWYSFLIVLGAGLAIWLAGREEQRVGLKKDTFIDLALWLLPFGILGARLYYVVFSWSTFRQRPLSVLYIWEGGLAIYGGLIAGLAVILAFCRRRKLAPLLICDVIAPGVALAQAIGRWGNYFNMEAYGILLTNPALCFFPLAVRIPAENGAEWHLATFFLESAWNLGVFWFLAAGRRHLFRREGDVVRFYLFLYAAGRLVIEDFRTDSLYAGGIRVSQLLSLTVMTGILLYLLMTKPGRRGLYAVIGLVFALPVLLYTLQVPFLPALSAGLRAGLLSGFSGWMIFALLVCYGRSRPEEVRYR